MGRIANTITKIEQIQLQQFKKLGIRPLELHYSKEDFISDIKNKEFKYTTKESTEEYEKYLNYIKNIKISKYDSSIVIYLMHNYADQLDPIIKKDFPSFTRPIFGEYPYGDIGAMVTEYEIEKKWIVLFQRGLFTDMSGIAKALAIAFPFNKHPHLITQEDFSNPDAHLLENINKGLPLFLQSILGLVTGKKAESHEIVRTLYSDSIDESYTLSPLQVELMTRIHDGINLFILSHEYGHILHFENHIKTNHNFFSTIEEFEKVMNSFSEELAADQSAVELMLRANSKTGSGPALSYIGAPLYFEIVKFANRFSEVLSTGQFRSDEYEFSDTHPPLQYRINIAEVVMKNLNGNEHDTLNALSFSNMYSNILKLYWSVCLEYLDEWHTRGLDKYLSPEFKNKNE